MIPYADARLGYVVEHFPDVWEQYVDPTQRARGIVDNQLMRGQKSGLTPEQSATIAAYTITMADPLKRKIQRTTRPEGLDLRANATNF